MSGASARAAKLGSIRSRALSMPGVRLISAFSQSLGRELQMLKSMDHRGACRALSIQWIIHRHQGKDFWAAMEDPVVFRQIIHQQQAQDLRKKRKLPQMKQDEWIKTALETAGLDVHSTDELPTNPIAIEHMHPFHLYRAVWTPRGAHAMAAHFRGPWVSFFDPNVGHFHCDSKEVFEEFLNDVLFEDGKYGTKWRLSRLFKREVG